MLSVVPAFVAVEAPPGWTREIKGPRIRLVPPTGGGRIVIAPIQTRPRSLPPSMFLERILLQESDRFPRLKQTEPTMVTSTSGTPGLVVDVAVLDAAARPQEWRCYSLFYTDTVFALLFLQSAPSRLEELRRIFLALVAAVSLPANANGSTVAYLPEEAL